MIGFLFLQLMDYYHMSSPQNIEEEPDPSSSISASASLSASDSTKDQPDQQSHEKEESLSITNHVVQSTSSQPNEEEYQKGSLPQKNSKKTSTISSQNNRFLSSSKGRLDHILRDHLQCSHKHARSLISTGKIQVNQEVQLRWETKIRINDKVSIRINAPNPKKLESLGAQLIYQDQAIVILNKPAGLLSAPIPQSDELNALVAANRLCKGPRRPRVVHRIDKETSGLLMFARTIPVARSIQEDIQDKKIKRVYRCIVQGVVKEAGGYIASGLIRDAGRGRRGSAPGTFKRNGLSRAPQEKEVKGKWSLTRYEVVSRGKTTTALEVEIFTGRTHQIRIHLAELGYPILGEWVYAGQRKTAPRLALHAARLTIQHPFKKERMSFEVQWPDDLARLKPIPPRWLKSKVVK